MRLAQLCFRLRIDRRDEVTEYAVGQSIRSLTEITDEYGREVIPAGEVGMVIGFVGNRLLVDWEDRELDRRVEVVVDPWQVYRLIPHRVR